MYGVVTGVSLAAVLWYIMFVRIPTEFWLVMSGSTLALGSISIAFVGRPFRKDEISVRHILIGVGSAIGLYLVFYIGNQLLVFVDSRFGLPFLDPESQVRQVYANRAGVPPALVAAMLVFPIAWGEEMFWRRFVQHTIADRFGGLVGYLAAAGCYVAVHLSCGNPMLLVAAAVCGLVWGGIYWKTGSIVPVLISHMVWDPLIFVVMPVGVNG